MGRTVGYTPSSASPRTVPVTVLVVLVLLVAVGAAGWAMGRSSAPDSKSSASSTPAGNTSGQSGATVPVASGTFPRTPEGAGDAFASYMRQVFDLTTAPVATGDAFLRQISAPGAEAEVAAKLNTKGLQNGAPNAINNFVPVRVITVPDPDGTVRALVWGSSILAVKSDGVTAQTVPVTSWTTITARLTWGADGTWKLSQVEDSAGPTPTNAGAPDDVSKFGKVLAATGRSPR